MAAQASCPQEQFPGQFLGRHELQETSANVSLVVVEQQHADLKIYVDGADGLWLNSPGERYGADYITIHNDASIPSTALCLYRTFQHSVNGNYNVRQYSSAGSEAAADLLNNASANWLLNTGLSLMESVAQFSRLADAMPGNFSAIPGIEFDTRYYAALARIKLRQFEEAWRDLQMIEVAARDGTDHYKVLLQKGRIRVRQRQWQEGIAYLEEALRSLKSAEVTTGQAKPLDRAEIAVFLGEAYIFSRNFDQAELVLNTAILEASGDFSMLGRIVNNLGLMWAIRSETPGLSREQIAEFHNKSLENVLAAAYFSGQSFDREIEQLIQNNVAIQYARMGERRKSLVHFLKVLSMLDEIDNPEFRGFLLSNLGNYTMGLGDYDKAAAYLEMAIGLREVSGGGAFSPDLCRLGNLYRLQDRLQDALGLHRTCLSEAESADDRLNQTEALLQISMDLEGLGRLEEAEASARISVELLEGNSDANLLQRALTQLANTMLVNQKLSAASFAISQALDTIVDGRYPNDRVIALATAMEIDIASGNKRRALERGYEAMAMIESLHTQLEAERLGPAWGNQTNKIYSRMAGLLFDDFMDEQDTALLEQGFAILERARDISLRQQLGAQISLDAQTLESRKQLDIFSSISQMLAASGNGDAELSALRFDYYHQHDLLSLARLNNVDTVPIPQPIALENVQRSLGQAQLLISYLLSDDSLYIFTVTEEKVDLIRRELTDETRALLSRAGMVLHSPDSFSRVQLQSYADLLLPDLERFPFVQEILIAGDATLYAFPFSALPLDANGESYRPLVARYSLKSIPSASAYFMPKPERGGAYSSQIAIFADPVFGGDGGLADRAASETRDVGGWVGSLPALPYSAEEAMDIAQQLDGPALIYTGARATRDNLVSKEVRHAKILHIATHGHFDSSSEDNVGLAFSTIDEHGNSDSGFITLTDLFGYTFSNELVVISGCDTAMGRMQAGVGLNGLSRGFLSQGVKHVIATLWPVSDRGAAKFMEVFYEHLAAEGDIGFALRIAQETLSRDPQYRNPYYWAGYVLSTVSPNSQINLNSELASVEASRELLSHAD